MKYDKVVICSFILIGVFLISGGSHVILSPLGSIVL